MSQITAHRGYCQSAPENSLAAFEAAIELGVDWIELDVQLTADECVIVFHDTNLKRIGGRAEVAQQEWRELRGLDLRQLQPDSLGGLHLIPLLSDVLDLVDGRVCLNLELKYPQRDSSAGRLVELVSQQVAEHQAVEWCALTSFNHGFVGNARESFLPIGVALDAPLDTLPDVAIISAARDLVTLDFVRRVHDEGKSLHVWTVNDEESLRRFMGWEVDNIITDRPELALAIRG